MWMGGTPPLGYAPNGRTLSIVKGDATAVQRLFNLYAELGSVPLVQDRLGDEGTIVPIRTIGKSHTIGGIPFSRSQIYRILSNPIYIGKIAHRGEVHEGLHDAIIEQKLWDDVQAKLKQNAQGEQRSATQRHTSLLAGRVFDASGEPLLATHACKRVLIKGEGPVVSEVERGSVRYRYYVSRALQHGKVKNSDTGMRIPALELEKIVAERIARWLGDPLEVLTKVSENVSPDQSRVAMARLEELASKVRTRQRAVVRSLCQRVIIHRERIDLEISAQNLAKRLELKPSSDACTITLVATAQLRRLGRKLTFVQDGVASTDSEANPELVKLLAKARQWWKRLADGSIDIAALAREEQINASYVSRVVRLNFLAPKLVEAILAARQPATISAQTLRLADLPVCWREQIDLFGG